MKKFAFFSYAAWWGGEGRSQVSWWESRQKKRKRHKKGGGGSGGRTHSLQKKLCRVHTSTRVVGQEQKADRHNQATRKNGRRRQATWSPIGLGDALKMRHDFVEWWSQSGTLCELDWTPHPAAAPPPSDAPPPTTTTATTTDP